MRNITRLTTRYSSQLYLFTTLRINNFTPLASSYLPLGHEIASSYEDFDRACTEPAEVLSLTLSSSLSKDRQWKEELVRRSEKS
ncbi:hypothetical protein [Sphingobacterium allocomposti]|uniref:hypothetical protein n=1 Tax=Sphingobacterium allocomposti TaxID=415956 RepID=UPI0011E7C117|nr:hypothetical protein [Sphingobacterium composti Yoo et al. 2007 non Ten et al. 2007]